MIDPFTQDIFQPNSFRVQQKRRVASSGCESQGPWRGDELKAAAPANAWEEKIVPT
jgi:hypothetical protein